MTVATSRRDGLRSLLPALLVALFALALAATFAVLGSEVGEGETHVFDMGLLEQALAYRHAHPWFAAMMRDFSGIGSTATLSLLTACIAGYLWLTARRADALLLAGSIASAALLVGQLKQAFGRARPDPAFAELVQNGLSFPSGHASMSAVVFLTLGALVAGTQRGTAARAYVMACAALVAALVGISRIALGVHWATDVLGGWAFGTAWATATVLLAMVLARRSAGRG